MVTKGDRISLANVWSNNFLGNGLKIGDEGLVIADYGATDSTDGYIKIENNARFKIKFDKQDVNICGGGCPFLFKEICLTKI